MKTTLGQLRQMIREELETVRKDTKYVVHLNGITFPYHTLAAADSAYVKASRDGIPSALYIDGMCVGRCNGAKDVEDKHAREEYLASVKNV